MRTNYTIYQLKKSKVWEKNKHLFEEEKPKRSKYRNIKVTDEFGNEYDSRKEYNRYRELKLLLKAGEIGFLARQVEYELNKGGSHSLVYRADFVYTDAKTGQVVVEDCKGFETKEFKKKEKLMKKIYAITVKKT
jgi:hypothetical protein